MNTSATSPDLFAHARTDLWPIFEDVTSSHSIGYIVSTDDIPGLPYPRIGEVYRRANGLGWGAWPMGAILGDDIGPSSAIGFKTRHAAIDHLVACARSRAFLKSLDKFSI